MYGAARLTGSRRCARCCRSASAISLIITALLLGLLPGASLAEDRQAKSAQGSPLRIWAYGPLKNAVVPQGYHPIYFGAEALDDTPPLDYVELFVDGTYVRTVGASGFQYFGDIGPYDAVTASPGLHEARLVVYNFDGRSAETRLSFTVEVDDGEEADDDGSVPPDGYGDPDEADYCLTDGSETDGYCGQNDIGPETERYYNEPPLYEPGTVGALAAPGYNRLGYGLADSHFETIYANEIYRQWFRDLDIRRARRVVPWDVVVRAQGDTRCGPRNTSDLVQIDEWVAAARALGQEMLISFEHTRGNVGCLPTVTEYRDATRAFRNRYPDIKLFTAWNEPNDVGGQPTATAPYRAGRFWNNLNWQCQNRCVVAAGDFLDSDFSRSYLDDYKRGLGHNARIWAWHAYTAGRTKSANRLRAFLNATRSSSKVWLTEQGAIVSWRARPTPLDAAEANARLRYLMDELPMVSTRIRRFYAYQWSGSTDFDAGLIDFRTGLRRGLYTVVKNRTNP
jgi:hypothetical protein